MVDQKLQIFLPTALTVLKRCSLLAFAFIGAVIIKSGFHYDSLRTLLEAALLFGFLSGYCYALIFSRKIRLFVEQISFFNVFLNVGLFYLIAKILPNFEIDRFSTAFWGGVLVNIFSWALNSISVLTPTLVEKKSPGLKQARAKVIGTRSINASSDQEKNLS